MNSGGGGRGAVALNHLPLLFGKNVYIDNLMKLVSKGLVIMTKKLYPGFSRVAYGLCTEILDSPPFSPILEHFVQGKVVMLFTLILLFGGRRSSDITLYPFQMYEFLIISQSCLCRVNQLNVQTIIYPDNNQFWYNLCVFGSDITSCSKGFPFHDSDSRMFPAIHVLVSHLNIEHFFKNGCRYETNWDGVNMYIQGIHFKHGLTA